MVMHAFKLQKKNLASDENTRQIYLQSIINCKIQIVEQNFLIREYARMCRTCIYSLVK
jgi:hypothetical protein